MDKINARKLYKQIRNSITPAEKSEWDKRIFTHFVNSDLFKSAELLLIYSSIGSEADTQGIIQYALNKGKRVAVPVCIGKTMFFYIINSLSELVIGKFGIPTADIGNNSKVTDFNNAICIVPAVCFDIYGNRIGYGGGYYDRFLSANPITAVGLCYERCICSKTAYEPFDMPVDYILTENCLRNSKCKEVSTYE